MDGRWPDQVEMFRLHVEKVVTPALKPGDIVVLASMDQKNRRAMIAEAFEESDDTMVSARFCRRHGR
jgi:hypothetical protein